MHWRASNLGARSPERYEDVEGGVPTSSALRGMYQHGDPTTKKGTQHCHALIPPFSLSLDHTGPLQKHVVGTPTTPVQSGIPYHFCHWCPSLPFPIIPQRYLQEDQLVCRERIPQCWTWTVFTFPSQHLKSNQQTMICELKLATHQKHIFKNKINHTDEFLNRKYVNMKYLGFSFFLFFKKRKCTPLLMCHFVLRGRLYFLGKGTSC